MTPTHATPGSVLINLDQAEWASAAISIATGNRGPFRHCGPQSSPRT